jgi:hypothetical protein
MPHAAPRYEKAEHAAAFWTERLDAVDGGTVQIYPSYPRRMGQGANSAEVFEPPLSLRVSRRPALEDDGARLGDDELVVGNYIRKTFYEEGKIAPFLAENPGVPSFRRQRRPPPFGSGLDRIGSIFRDGGHDVARFSTLLSTEAVTPDAYRELVRLGGDRRASPFAVGMAYGVSRRTLDIWKTYLGFAPVEPFPFYARPEVPRLEVVPLAFSLGGNGLHLEGTSISSFGYVELGIRELTRDDPKVRSSRSAGLLEPTDRSPYWLSADVIAHEIGHQVLYGVLGAGALGRQDGSHDWLSHGSQEFRAFHEAFADITSLLGTLHFADLRRAILQEVKGDIFTETALSQIGEAGSTNAIRRVYNGVRYRDVGTLSIPKGRRGVQAEAALIDNYYQLSRIVSGALFDILVAFAGCRLLALGVVTVEALQGGADVLFEDGNDNGFAERKRTPAALRARLADLCKDAPETLDLALVLARDDLGWLLADSLALLGDCVRDDACDISFDSIIAALTKAARGDIGGVDKADIVRRCFAWRFG